MFKACMKDPEIRGLILVYLIANGVFKTQQMISVFFVEQTWAEQGLGVSTKSMSIVTFISYFPSVIILMGSPKVVPKYFNYTPFIRTMCLILSLTIIAMPFIRDLFSHSYIAANPWIAYLDIVLTYSFNPKLFSPFVNYLINSKIRREERTSANSITFITSTLCSSVLMNIIAPLYAASFGSPYFVRLRPFNKYISFTIIFLLLVTFSSFMKKTTKKII